MLILGSLKPVEPMCSFDGGDNDNISTCGLLKLNESKLTCLQVDCNEHHPAICIKQESKQTHK